MTKASIIIPTFNRPGYLRRILGYYAEGGGSEFVLIVADSSSDENKARNGEIVAAFPNLKILYLASYPEDINPLPKFADTLNHVQSKYCVFCADDDFITPNGISQSVDFLENNPDFTVAHGSYISFRLERDETEERFCWQPTHLPPGIKIYRRPADTLSRVNTESSITFPHAEERLRYHLSNFCPTFYAVHRTDFLKLLFEEMGKFTSDYQFVELLHSMLALIHGKMKCLDVLYDARDAGSARGEYRSSIRDFVKEGTYNEKYARFRDCLVMHLTKSSQLDVEASKKVIDDAMAAYMKKYYNLCKAVYVLDHLPDWMDKGIRALYRKLFLPRQTTYSSKYYDDLNKIRLCVLACGKNGAGYSENIA